MQEDRQKHIEEDKLLLARAKENPRDVFAALYEKYVDRIYGFVMRRVGDAMLAEDITSKVFIKAYERLAHFEFQGHPYSSYLFQIAVNEILKNFRDTGRRPTQEIEEHHAVTETDTQAIDTQLAFAKVSAVLPQLPEAYRQAVELKYFGQLGNQEIAEALNWSETKVGVTLFRAHQKLNSLLNNGHVA